MVYYSPGNVFIDVAVIVILPQLHSIFAVHVFKTVVGSCIKVRIDNIIITVVIIEATNVIVVVSLSSSSCSSKFRVSIDPHNGHATKQSCS